jgi:hypothetical protein
LEDECQQLKTAAAPPPTKKRVLHNYTITHYRRTCTMSAANLAGPPGDDDVDNESILTADMPAQRAAAAATPEDEVAQAMAEVAATGGRAPQTDRAGEEAVMGATAAADGVAGFEVTDESGELVKQRFLVVLGT